MTSRHPDLAAEQQVLDRAHDCYEAAIAREQAIVAGDSNAGADPNAQRKIREKAIKKLADLEAIDTARLLFGRLDFQEGRVDTAYVGPTTIMDGNKALVVDWTRNVVKPFFKADENDPLGLRRRRTFDLLERDLREITDEIFVAETDGHTEPETVPASGRTVLDRVAAELERAREPRMQNIVASIVADQYRLIEAPRDGIFIVQGGPGTGKTAVALHRAVYLLRNHEDLGRVLVVGPNAAFMAYIAGVLPGLGETTVDQVTVGSLAQAGEARPRGVDVPEVAALKGDARMATVLREALQQRIRPASEPYALSTQGVTVRLTIEAANAVLQREQERERPYMEARRRFVDAMRAEIESLMQARFARGIRRRTVDRDALQRYLATDRMWINYLERMWPTMSAVQLVHEILTIEQRLRSASDGWLTDAQARSLIRRGVRTVGVHPWTRDDLPLIDEAHSLVQGTVVSYGYVIVDEAQDLTPMQLRMVARRSTSGDLTLVGDIAQATGPTRYRSWDEIVAEIPLESDVRQDQLTIGYRVPRSIMALANELLPLIAPDLPPTQPVREARVDPRFDRVAEGALADAVAAAVADLADDHRSVGVIVPERQLVEVRGALAGIGIAAGDISTDQLEKRVTLLSSAEAKGLEFDRVVLAEPHDIVTESVAGWSELYVALSRATQQLVVVHSQPLPSPLPGGEPLIPDAPDESTLVPDTDLDTPTEDTSDLDLDLDFDLDLGADDATLEPIASVSDEPAIEDDTDLDQVQDVDEDGFDVPAVGPEVIAEIAESPGEVSTPVEPPVDMVAAFEPDRHRTDHANGHVRHASGTAVRLGSAFSEALVFAKMLHDGHTRRGTAVPYLSHLLGTAALVLEDGGDETETIAALLHDSVEDTTPQTAEKIRDLFGDDVASIVLGCTDPESPASFRETKTRHLEDLERGSKSVRRVALAEKLDNARALRRDLERYGAETWKHADIDPEETLWYLRSLVALFDRTFPSVLAEELRRVVDQIESIAG